MCRWGPQAVRRFLTPTAAPRGAPGSRPRPACPASAPALGRRRQVGVEAVEQDLRGAVVARLVHDHVLATSVIEPPPGGEMPARSARTRSSGRPPRGLRWATSSELAPMSRIACLAAWMASGPSAGSMFGGRNRRHRGRGRQRGGVAIGDGVVERPRHDVDLGNGHELSLASARPDGRARVGPLDANYDASWESTCLRRLAGVSRSSRHRWRTCVTSSSRSRRRPDTAPRARSPRARMTPERDEPVEDLRGLFARLARGAHLDVVLEGGRCRPWATCSPGFGVTRAPWPPRASTRPDHAWPRCSPRCPKAHQADDARGDDDASAVRNMGAACLRM